MRSHPRRGIRGGAGGRAAARPPRARAPRGRAPIPSGCTPTPLLHASAARDPDELSGGRMVLGLGSGTRRMNEDWYAVPFSAPAARMQELVLLLRAAFRAQKGGGL